MKSSSDFGSSSSSAVSLGVSRFEDDGEALARDLVERVPEEPDVLRLRDLLAMEVVSRRELEREGVAGQVGRRCLGEQARDRDRAPADGLDDRALPCLRYLAELEIGQLGR